MLQVPGSGYERQYAGLPGRRGPAVVGPECPAGVGPEGIVQPAHNTAAISNAQMSRFIALSFERDA